MDKILIVDDEQEMVDLFTYILENEGYKTESASNGTLALAKIKANKYPVITLDLMLPGMDGLQLLEEIQKTSPDTQVVMITASAGIDSAVFAVEHGAFAYLSKPVKYEDLAITAKNAYDKHTLLEGKEKVEAELERMKKGEVTYTLLVINSDNTIKNVNKATEHLLGFNEGELAGRNVGEILGGALSSIALKGSLGRGKVDGLKIPFSAKDKSKLELTFSGTVLTDVNKGTVGIVGMLKNQ